METVSKLRFWCYKILPLVYDDSLSYYEAICKATQKLNEVIDNVNELPDYINKEIVEQIGNDNLFEALFTKIIKTIASCIDDAEFTSEEKFGGEIFWHNGELVECVKHMDVGTNYIVGTNIEVVNIIDLLNDIKRYISTKTEKYNERSDREIQKGEYLFWKDKFLKAKQTIANDTLLTNDMFEEVCIGDELKLETVNRISEDTKLSTKIDKNKTDLLGMINTNATDITSLKEKDNELTSLINNNTTEITKNTSAIKVNTKSITGLEAKLNTATGSYVTPEMYGATGDGTVDDSSAILNAFNAAKNDKKILVMSKKYLIGSDITLDFQLSDGNYGTVDIVTSGVLVMNNTLTLLHGSACNISLKITGGTINTGNACVIGFMEHSTIDMIATNVNCTAYKLGGNDGPLHWCDLSIVGMNNYRTLKHGDTGAENNHATGRYRKIIVTNKDNTLPIEIDDVYDLNIEYLEGHFVNNNHNTPAFIINGGGSIRMGTFAQGGKASYMLEITNCSDVIADYIFLLGEEYDTPYPNAGIKITNSRLVVCTLRALYLDKMIDNDTSSTIIVNNNLYKNITNLVTNALIKSNIDNVKFNLKSVIGTTSKVNSTNLSLNVLGNQVQIGGELTTTGDLSAYSTIITIENSLALPAFNYNTLLFDAQGNSYPCYNEGSYIKTRKAVANGTKLFVDISYKRAINF